MMSARWKVHFLEQSRIPWIGAQWIQEGIRLQAEKTGVTYCPRSIERREGAILITKLGVYFGKLIARRVAIDAPKDCDLGGHLRALAATYEQGRFAHQASVR